VARAPIVWRVATVTSVIAETAHAKTIAVEAPGWPGHVAGQHLDIRLTAEDGYQAQRSYSIASPPEDARLELTVELIEDGEVSPYLTGELREGDSLELRGPVGGHFTWRVEDGGPLLLVAGGSGLVPLMAMLRHRAARDSGVETHLLVSARALDDVLYREELARLAQDDGLTPRYTLTREQPEGWTGFSRRIDSEMLASLGVGPGDRPRTYVCGPTPFVERAADLLVELGYEPGTIRAERFGPTGG
jgi:ferredoxin-NADP reductase